MKRKTVNDRPTIVVRINAQKYRVVRDEKNTRDVVIPSNSSNPEDKLNLKEETKNTGDFKVFAGRWGYDVVTTDGEVIANGDFWKNPVPNTFSSLDEALAIIHKANIDLSENQVYIRRLTCTYMNAETKEKTRDLKVAEAWFKGKNPFMIEARTQQQVGIWVDGAEDHVEISFWYNNHTRMNDFQKWEKAPETGFWLYPDGTISHFWKGKPWGEKIFVEKRQKYQSFDHRFQELLVGQYNIIDLRSSACISDDHNKYELCPETLKILEKVGFPKQFWSWSETNKQDLKYTYNLIDFCRKKQVITTNKAQAKRNGDIDSIPFDMDDESTWIYRGEKGSILRVPAIVLTYKSKHGGTKEVEDSWEVRDPVIASIKLIEKYRIWIKKNGKEIIYQKSYRNQTAWKTCKEYDLDVAPTTIQELRADRTEPTKEQTELFKELMCTVNKIKGYLLNNAFSLTPVMNYCTEYIDHLDLWDLKTFCSFLKCYAKAPSLIDYLVKNHKLDLILHYNAYRNERNFDLENFLEKFYISLSEYKERKNAKIWKNLGVTKDMFYLLMKHPERIRDITSTLKNSIPMPPKVGIPHFNPDKAYEKGDIVQYGGKMFVYEELLPKDNWTMEHPNVHHWSSFDFLFPTTLLDAHWHELVYPYKGGKWGQRCTLFNTIPFKYIQLVYSMICDSRMIRSGDVESAVGTLGFERLLSLNKRGLNLQLLLDYYRTLSSIHSYNADVSRWPTFPQNNDALKQLHDEAVTCHHLLYEERQAEYRRQQKEAEAKKTTQYKKYYKKLQAFKMEDDKYTVVIPEKLSEIVAEGAAMHHCVGGYTSMVANGETFVFFLREKANVNQCLVTFNICPSDKPRNRGKKGNSSHKWIMDQAFAAHDNAPSKEQITFIKKWAEAKDVDFTTILPVCASNLK